MMHFEIETVVIDSGSSDRTIEIAQTMMHE